MKGKKIVIGFFILTLIITNIIIPCTTVSAIDDRSDIIENDYLQATVNNDENQIEYLRFQLKTVEGEIGNNKDDNKDLLYKNFYSGYTTISINGECFVYGAGEDVILPYVDATDNSHISAQKFGNIVVQQKLEFTKGFSDSYNDMLRVSYKIENSTENANVGIRIMIDPMLDSADSMKLNTEGITLDNEIALDKKTMPNKWSLKNDSTDVEAYGIIPDNAKPDSFIFANWDSIYDNRWQYKVNVNNKIDDGAIAFIWDEKNIEANTTSEYSIMYGVKNTTVINDIQPTDNVNNEAAKNETITSTANDKNTAASANSTQITKNESDDSNHINNNFSVINTGNALPISIFCVLVIAILFIVVNYRKRRCK